MIKHSFYHIRIVASSSYLIFLLTLLFLGNDGNNQEGIASASTPTTVEPIIQWIRDNDGFVSDKIEYRRRNNDDTSTSYGFFAKELLNENESIMVIPKKCYLTSGGTGNMCDTTWNLIEQYTLGEESFFKDYVLHLFEERGKLPEAWSREGQALLEKILGNELVPQIPSSRTFRKDCKGSGHILEEDAYDHVLSRSWENVMMPLYDSIPHRNGKKWRNCEATSTHNKMDSNVTVYAYRTIEADEELYISYNDCLDKDCYDLFDTYGTQHLLMDYGFVEEYPQRWIFHIDNLEQDTETIVFELIEDQEEDDLVVLKVHWHTNVRPDLQMINFMLNQLKRLRTLDTYIMENSLKLYSEHERTVITKFYNSMKIALQHAIWDVMDEDDDDVSDDEQGGKEICDVSQGKKSCISAAYVYDTLDSIATESDMSEEPFICHRSAMVIGGRGYKNLDVVTSQYQEIAFKYNQRLDDTCMWLSGWAQTCTSFRQYHEALVHYPATFVKEVKRVAFIGGGDNMIVHEILKYSSTLELVIGMELDQQVLRSSFKNLGTIPYFDDYRVQWWFGDATKSLLMLPSEYFGTFDLLFVDLQTFVADALKVTPDLSVMDTLKLLLKPEGIIAKNEDFPNRQVTDFATYTVDLEYCDLPALCRQSITIGSNGLDLLQAKHYNHNVDTIYLKKSLTENGRFNEWFGFRNNIIRNESTTTIDNNTSTSKEEKFTLDEQKQKEDTNSKDDEEKDEGKALAASSQKYGVFLVIEAEDLDVTIISSYDVALNTIQQALESHGMVMMDDVSTTSEGGDNSSWYDGVIIFQEGYIAVRKRSSSSYVAMDLVLWDKIDEMDALKASLLTNLGGNYKEASSYRFVIGGMAGASKDPYAWQLVKQEIQTCDDGNDDENCSSGNNSNVDDDTTTSKETMEESDIELIYTAIVQKLVPQKEEELSTILVLCGNNEEKMKCSSLEALQKAKAETIIPIFTCPNINKKEESSAIATNLLLACEIETMQHLRKSLLSKEGKKINAIWLDPSAVRPMAQILLKLLKTKIGRMELIQEEKYIVVVVTQHQQVKVEKWRKIFLERFRTDVTPFFEPAKEAHITVSSSSEEKDATTMELGIYSSGDKMFYLNLVNMVKTIDNTRDKKQTKIKTSVENVSSGYANYVPGFAPKFFNNAAYDKTRASKQWLSQSPTGIQIVFQFELTAPEIPLNVGDKVLYRYYDEVWVGQWIDATIQGVNAQHNTYDLLDARNKKRRNIGRSFLRPVENDAFTTYKIGERILVRSSNKHIWSQGILSRSQGGDTFQVRVFDGDGTTANNVPRKDLISQFEGVLEKDLPSLSCDQLEQLLKLSLKKSSGIKEEVITTQKTIGTSGCVLVTFFGDEKGNNTIILSWDGSKHFDINYYSQGKEDGSKVVNSIEDVFLTEIPYLTRKARDVQPRGYGRVVNFASEIDEDPYWLIKE